MKEFLTHNKHIVFLEFFLLIFSLYIGSLFYGHFAHLPDFSVWPWTFLFHINDGSITSGQQVLVFGAVGIVFATFNAIAMINPMGQSARFANQRDIAKAGLLSKKGIVLAKWRGKYLTTNDYGHTLVAAPTRSGKGVGLVIPRGASAIVMDIKGENFEKTSGFRASKGHKIYRFAPQDEQGNTHRFNPFDLIRFDSPFTIKDLNRLAHNLFPLPERGDTIWRSESQSLFVAIAMYLHQNPTSATTLGEVYNFLHKNADLKEHLKNLVDEKTKLDEAIIQRFNNFIGKADKERSGIKSTMNEILETWAEPLVDDAMSDSDFSFEDFRKERSTLYICIGYDDLASMAPVLNFMFEMALEKLASKPFDEKSEHEILMLLDEFSSLGDLKIIRKRISDLAGYGIRIMAILQDLNQLEETYGKNGAQTILSNCHVHVFFAVNDQNTRKYLSDVLGEKIVKRRQKSYRGGAGFFADPPHISFVQEKQDLMTPDAIGKMPNKQLLILKQECNPIKANRIRYYEDKMFKNCEIPAYQFKSESKQ